MFSCIVANPHVMSRPMPNQSCVFSVCFYSFLRAYDLQMSKDDHVHLVKVVFSLVTIPNLESPLLRSWSSLLVLLLK